MSRPAGRPLPLALAASLFLLSGAGALVVETTWLRWFRDLLGATAPAASATLVAFFSGQALGAVAGARIAARAARPLRAYAHLEAGAALGALAAPLLLAALRGALDPATEGLRSLPAALEAARYAAALAATLPASAAFGATFPVLAAATLRAPGGLGPRGGSLYAANALGAAIGTALATFWLPEALGVREGYGLGAAALALASAGAGLASARLGAPSPRTEAAPREPDAAPRVAPALGPSPSLAGLHALSALSGFGALAAQVLLVMAFARVLNQSTFAFGAVLVVDLLALAAGAAAVAAWARARPGGAPTALGAGLVAAALAFAAFPAVFVASTGGLAFLGTEAPWPAYLGVAFGKVLGTAGPALLAAALVWPAVLAAAGARGGAGGGHEAGRRAGSLLLSNTLGAIAGALAAPYLLVPSLGLWWAFTAVAGLYGLGAIFLPAGPRLWRDVALGLGWILVLSRGSPGQLPAVRLEPGQHVISVEQDAAGLVTVLEDESGRWIQTDNHYALGGSADAVHQERQGHLPLVLHGAPRRVAFLGSATGSSAGAALAHPVQALTLVELVPGVADAARIFFRRFNAGVYDDPRTRVVVDDARSFLRTTPESYDVIVADLFVPWRAGTGALYAREHFARARARLAPGGLFCQWLPLYQLGTEELLVAARTFLDVFPDALVFRGDFYATHPILALVGLADGRLDVARTAEATRALARAGVTDRWVTQPEGPWALYLGPLAPALAASEVPLNTDDHPVIEFMAARGHAGGRRGRIAPVTGLRFTALAKAWIEAGAAQPAPVAGFGPAERAASFGGHALQTAAALHVAGRDDEAGQALAAAAAQLPRSLFLDAPEDPTAAQVWHAGPARLH